jgi:subtilisin family serine protease
MKKKVIFISGLIIMALILLASFLANSASSQENKIDSEVYSQLEENGKVNVVVTLNEEKGFFIFKEKREKVIGLEVNEETLEKLEMDKRVEQIDFAPQIHAFLQDSAPQVNATNAWKIQINNKNITGIDETICIIDTGINFSHPNLIGKNKTCIIDCYNKDCVENCTLSDDNGHGTHVAGIAAASSGINGIANGASLIGLKVLDEDGDAHSQNGTINIRDAIQWCVQNRENYNISVISMSLGSNTLYSHYCDSSFSSTFTKAINNATAYNISVITATGNQANTTAIASPACIENATAVGSIRKDDSTFDYSRNALTDLIAPGYLINSTWGSSSCLANCDCSGNYMVCSGTSMAAPHIAGAFAVIRQYARLQNSTILMPREIQSTLNDTGKQIYDSGSGLYLPRIDLLSAVISLDETSPEVNLISPVNNVSNFSMRQVFRCNASDAAGIRNLTLKIWNSSFLYYNNTKTANGTFLQGEWNLTLRPENYTWSCIAYDLNSNEEESANRTLNITNDQNKKMIVIGIDGFAYSNYVSMLKNNQLGNFSRLMSSGGFNITLNITGHSNISTAPGNAEIHSGLNETLTNITDNNCGKAISEGNSTFERLKSYNSSIITGSIYGKTTCYIPNGILGNGLSEVDWWQNQSTYSPELWSDGTSCDDSIDVAEKAAEFIGNYSNTSFYLFVYFGVPDCSAHAAGDNSSNYNNSFINVDNGLGVLLDSLEYYSINESTQIIITADHGWNKNSLEHSIADTNTLMLPLITNNYTLIQSTTSDNIREQCEIAPTTLDYFGINESSYQEIIDNGCESMVYRDEENPNVTINSPASGTFSSSSILFNVTIDEQGYCEYSLDNEAINYTMSTLDNLNFDSSRSLSNSNYIVRFYCNDSRGNKNYSETTSFTVAVASSTGGGSSSSRSPAIYTLTQQEAEKGYSINLVKNSKLKFNLTKIEHIITAKSILNNSVVLMIESSPIETVILIGEEKRFDLTNDKLDDLSIKLNSIYDGRANLTIKIIKLEKPAKEGIEKSMPEEETEKEINEDAQEKPKEKNLNPVSYLLFIPGLIIALIIIAIIFAILIKTQNENENEKLKAKPQRKKKIPADLRKRRR